MSGVARHRLASPLLQLPLAVAVGALMAFDPLLALAGFVALVAVWPPAVPWRPVRTVRVLSAYALFLPVWLLLLLGYLEAAHALGFDVPPQTALQELADPNLPAADLAVRVLGIVVLAPLLEEIFFRGYLFTALALLLPKWATQVVTSLLFGLAHGLAYALPIGLLALLLGFLRQRHASLAPPVLAHALHNGIVVGVTLLWPTTLDLLYPR